MADNKFNSSIEALFGGMDSIISSRTVVGDPIYVGEMTLVPLLDVSFAVGAGAFNADKKERGAGGLGGKISASAVLVIHNGNVRLVGIKNQDTADKILNLIPEVMDRFCGKKDKDVTEKDISDMLEKAKKET